MRIEVDLDSLSDGGRPAQAPSRAGFSSFLSAGSGVLRRPVGERRLELAGDERGERALAGRRDLPGDLVGLRELQRGDRDLARLVGGLDAAA